MSGNEWFIFWMWLSSWVCYYKCCNSFYQWFWTIRLDRQMEVWLECLLDTTEREGRSLWYGSNTGWLDGWCIWILPTY